MAHPFPWASARRGRGGVRTNGPPPGNSSLFGAEQDVIPVSPVSVRKILDKTAQRSFERRLELRNADYIDHAGDGEGWRGESRPVILLAVVNI